MSPEILKSTDAMIFSTREDEERGFYYTFLILRIRSGARRSH